MERHPRPGSVELALEGEWAPLDAIDKKHGGKTMSKDFPAKSNPNLMITMSHDADLNLEGCNAYTFTRPEQPDSFFVVIVDRQYNVARVAILSDDTGAEPSSRIKPPTIEEQGELGKIVEAYVDSQVAELAADMLNR